MQRGLPSLVAFGKAVLKEVNLIVPWMHSRTMMGQVVDSAH